MITDLSGEVMAYASVAMTGIDRSMAPSSLARHASDPIPALLLARPAVDRRVAGLGVGTALVAHVLCTAVELNAKAACRAVVVNASSVATRSWWERLVFTPFDPADPGGLDLYLMTGDIETTLRSL